MADIVAGRVPEDIARCVQLWVQALRHRDGDVASGPVAERMRTLFNGPVVRFALSGDPLMGFALTTPKPGDGASAVLERIAVVPAATGQGIGRALLRDAVQSSKDAGCSTIELAVRRTNAAIRLYQAEGFEPVSEPIPHPLGGEPTITYSRHL